MNSKNTSFENENGAATEETGQENKEPARAAQCLQVLGHPARLMILDALRHGEKTVGELEDATGCSQSNVSQHLRIMRDREIVVTRREGNRVFYSIADERITGVIDAVKDAFCRMD